jgi:PAS domain S-box-containing protein
MENPISEPVSPQLAVANQAKADLVNDVSVTPNVQVASGEIEDTVTQDLRKELRLAQTKLDVQGEELRRTRLDLERFRARAQKLYDQAPVGYCSICDRGVVIETNQTLATLLDIDRSEIMHQPFANFIHVEDLERYNSLKNNILSSRRTQSRELRMMKRDGTSCWMELIATANSQHEEDVQFRLVVTDISPRRESDESLRSLLVR